MSIFTFLIAANHEVISDFCGLGGLALLTGQLLIATRTASRRISILLEVSDWPSLLVSPALVAFFHLVEAACCLPPSYRFDMLPTLESGLRGRDESSALHDKDKESDDEDATMRATKRAP